MKTAIYLRVSTLDQNHEAQRRELEAYAARHNWPVVAVYEDVASGQSHKRPGMAALLADARTGKFDAVLCWKMDRFGNKEARQEIAEVYFKELARVKELNKASKPPKLHIKE